MTRTIDLVKMIIKYVFSLIPVYLEVMVTNHFKMMAQGVKHTTFVQTITRKIGTKLKTVHSSTHVSCLAKEAKSLQLMAPQGVKHTTSVQTITRKTGMKLKIVMIMILVNQAVKEGNPFKIAVIR